MPDLDPDATINTRRPAGHREVDVSAPVQKTSAINLVILLSGLTGLALVGGAAYVLFGPASVAPEATRQPPAITAGVAQPPSPRMILPHRTEAEILAQQALVPIPVWFAANPRIMVLDFPDLLSQGMAFNRIAAFLEKAGLPRDRVLNDQELAAAIKAENATPETYYYGHDYRLADVVRFFAMADLQKFRLSAEEEALRAILVGSGMLTAKADGAVISIPREGSDPFVDASGRMSLLRHELSHGEFFTSPDYADFTRRFWAVDMNESDRAGFRGFLTRQGYDPKDEDLLINEMQAHLMHTTDIRYFNARDCGLPLARVNALRAMFAAKMPAGWLQDVARKAVASLP